MDGISTTRRKHLEGYTLSYFSFSVLFVLLMLSTPRSAMALNAPSSLTATSTSSSQINLSWTDNSTDETGFRILMDQRNDGNFVQIAIVGANIRSYSKTGLSDGSMSSYRVRAYNGRGDSADSNTATAVTRTAYAVNAPTNLTASALSPSQVELSWTDNSINEAQFQIERATYPNRTGPFSVVGTVGPNVTSFTHTGLTAGTWYYYRVRAVNYDKLSGYTSVVDVQLWTITASAGAGGSIAPAGTVVVNGGDSKTFTITPNFAYRIESVLVDNVPAGAISSYPFPNISANHTIVATFVETTPPTGTIKINNGAAYAKTTAVALTLSATDLSGVTEMQFSNDAIAWSAPEPYAVTKAWDLLSGDGTKNVYVQYKDSVGNWSPPNAISADIVLDTVPPTGTILIHAGAHTTNLTSVTLTQGANDALSGVSQMQFSVDNIDWTAPEPYAAIKTWTLSSGDGIKTVWVKFSDMAGNWSPAIADSILLDTIQPLVAISAPTAGLISTHTPTLTFTVTEKSGTSKIGVMRNTAWFLDMNGNGAWEDGGDVNHHFGELGDIPVAGDWNGDGTSKIGVFRNGEWYLDMNNVGMTSYVDVNPNNPGEAAWHVVGTGDFNSDGKSDMLFQHTGSNDLVVWYMNGITMTSYIYLSSGDPNWNVVSVGDFNGDSKPDILWKNISTGLVATWIMNGATLVNYVEIGSATLNWQIVGTGDFNGDGKTDILWRDISTGAVAIWTMDGVTHVGYFDIDSAAQNWLVDSVGDLNGDGKADILLQDTNTGDLLVWYMNGVIHTNSAYINPKNPGSPDWKTIAIADFNSDGKKDLLFQHSVSGDLVVWYMNGIGTNGIWDAGDVTYYFGSLPGSVPVTGDWNGYGKTNIGIYYNGAWYLDMNGNGAWDETPTDSLYSFGGIEGAIPVTGDWTGSGTTKIGVYVPGTGSWYLDLDGNGAWDGTPTDTLYFFGGIDGAIPVTGDWTGNGTTKIGVFVPSTGRWYLDLNGNGAWEEGIDDVYNFGAPGDIPVTGDWYGTRAVTLTTKVDGVVVTKLSGSRLDALSDGPHTVRVEATDAAGNTGFAEVSFEVDCGQMQLSNVTKSSSMINTEAFESSTIFFTVNSPVTVTLKIIPEKIGPNGAPVYQTTQNCAAAGAYLFTWDGRNNAGMVVKDEAYLYVLEASDGTHAGIYSPAAPTGTATVACSQSTGMSPLKNIPMTITYAPDQPSRVSLSIVWSSQTFTILNAFPALPATQTFVWDGRNPDNKLLDAGAKAYCSVVSLFPENYLITMGDAVKITDLKTDPYVMHLAYGQFTRIKYMLSRNANVSISLTSPLGTVISLVTNQFQSAGPQELTWGGMDAADLTGMGALITEEGDYLVTVQAVDPETGSSRTAKGNVRIGF